MTGWKMYVGFVWAFPVTVFGLIYASLFALFKWYTYKGGMGNSLVWVVDDKKSPAWLINFWKGWNGHTIGNVIVLRRSPENGPITLKHELKHVDQCMRLGVFQPIVYVMSYLAIKYGCPGSDPYYTTIFEVDARRAAGQVIDMEGALKKLAETKS